MWDLSGPGIEPVSPALAGRSFTSEPPGKPQCIINELIFFKKLIFVIIIFSLMKTLLLLVAPCGVWDHSSLTRNQTCAPCLGSTESQRLDHQGKPITELILLNMILSLYTVVGGKISDTFVKSRLFVVVVPVSYNFCCCCECSIRVDLSFPV